MTLRSRIPVLLAVAALAACGGSRSKSSSIPVPGGPDGPGTGGTTGTLSIGADATVAKGRTATFSAKLAHDGVEDDCTSTATWSSSDPAIGIVSHGVVTAQAVGQTFVTATCSAHSDTALLTVTAAEVTAIAVAPASAELPAGLSEQLTASATFSDGTTSDVTADVTWSSSAPAALSVSNDVGTEGVVTATGTAGDTATITATYPNLPPVSVSRSVTGATVTAVAIAAVPPSLPPGIAFSPAAPSVPLGVDVQFSATATLSDGQTVDVTPSAQWSSSSPGVAGFAVTPGDPSGLATTLAAGSTDVTATVSGHASTPLTLAVGGHAISAVAIVPDAATLTVGETLQLAGQASFTDDATPQDVTLTGWFSSAAGAATVSGAGLVTAVAPGFATIAASYAAGGQMFLVTTQMTVVAPASTAVLSYVSITPGSVKGGRPVKGVVALTGPANTDTVVQLTSSSTNVTVPATVTIPAGSARSAQFTVDTTRPRSKVKVKITATLGDQTKTTTLNLRK